MKRICKWEGSEADLCSAFIAHAEQPQSREELPWKAYAETGGFDILMVRADGVQLGIEAKLQLNTHVVAQAVERQISWHIGPDYRAVLVPAGKSNTDLELICQAVGVTVITYRGERNGWFYTSGGYGPPFIPSLPYETSYGYGTDDWHEWAPAERCKLPDWVPDVQAGCRSPIALTAWKVKAIKLCIVLDERPVTRADFKALKLSPTMWLCPNGWLKRTPDGFIKSDRTPDFSRQHPINYAQIEADKKRWIAEFPQKSAIKTGEQNSLL